MSDFNNPFAEPETQNIFKDAAVQQAAGRSQTVVQSALIDFNPFADPPQSTGYGSQAHTTVRGGPPPPAAAAQLAVLEPSYGGAGGWDARPAGTGGVAGGTAGGVGWEAEELRKRQEELEHRAAELERREQELTRTLNVQERRNNFPPFPPRCPIQPCFYQDFSVDIPLEFQKIVKSAYYLWMGYVCVLVLNILCALTYLIASIHNGIDNRSGATLGLSVFYAVLFTPCSFLCWYRPVYKAFRDDSSFNFFLFFFIFFFQFCVCIIQFLGIEGWGSVGVINSSHMLASGKAGAVVAGVLMMLVAVLFGVAAAFDFIILVRVHRIFRSSGASFAKAQDELARGVMSNKTVQRTAGNVAASAAKSTAEQHFGSTGVAR